jgi:hypothetical protein
MYTPGSPITKNSLDTWLHVDLPNNKDFQDMSKRIEKIEERLSILQPNEELHEKYPAFREAYEHYKLIEKLVNNQISKEE